MTGIEQLFAKGEVMDYGVNEVGVRPNRMKRETRSELCENEIHTKQFIYQAPRRGKVSYNLEESTHGGRV